jgi:dihydrolipoamide dehydrogenase
MNASQNQNYDLVVIGGGPGGYIAAIEAAKAGWRTACIEKAALGGVCLNIGCIPTKALLHQAELVAELQDSPAIARPATDPLPIDWPALIEAPAKVIGRLSKGIEHLFKRAGVQSIFATGRIVEAGPIRDDQPHPCAVELTDSEGQRSRIRAARVILATGARPRPLPGIAFDGQRVIGSTDAMQLDRKPGRLVIAGAGAIGVEFASFFSALGCEVTLVEMLDRILPLEDADVSAAVARQFRRQRITMQTRHRVTAANPADAGLDITLESSEGKTTTCQADHLLVAIGVTGRWEDLVDPSLDLQTDGGRVVTDYQQTETPTYQTSLQGVYAIGDVIGPPWLAHKASAEARACVGQLLGRPSPPIDYRHIPACTYCRPQVASIGPTQQQLDENQVDYVVGQYPLTGHGLAVAVGQNAGLVKLLAERESGRLLAVHMVGRQVTELIGEAALACTGRLTLDDLAATVHPHPTMNEALHEAALIALEQLER